MATMPIREDDNGETSTPSSSGSREERDWEALRPRRARHLAERIMREVRIGRRDIPEEPWGSDTELFLRNLGVDVDNPATWPPDVFGDVASDEISTDVLFDRALDLARLGHRINCDTDSSDNEETDMQRFRGQRPIRDRDHGAAPSVGVPPTGSSATPGAAEPGAPGAANPPWRDFTGVVATIASHHMRTAQDLTVRPDVVSDLNLGAFLEWLGRVGLTQAMAYIRACKIINHRVAHDNIPTLDPQVRLADGKFYPLQSVDCQQQNCDRCRASRGGYKFQYVGPWTCEESFGDALQDKTPLGARTAWLNCARCRACSVRRACVKSRIEQPPLQTMPVPPRTVQTAAQNSTGSYNAAL